MMPIPLGSTFGVWLVTVWIQTLLQGCALLQGWLYFHWYSNDHWGLKTMVAGLLAMETFEIVVWFQITYFYLIDGFGDYDSLFIIHWQDSAQLFTTCLSAFIVEVYFGYCIYVLNRKNKIIPGIIMLLALGQIAFGIAQTVLTAPNRLGSFLRLGSTKAIVTSQAGFALVCYVMITASLVQYLAKHKGNVKSTNTLLTSLIIYAVNRGAVTVLCALLNLVLFLALPNTFYFFIGFQLSGKVYLNSALATLNSRQHIVKKSHVSDGGVDWTSHIRMDGLSHDAPTRPSTNEDTRIEIIVTKQSVTDRAGYDGNYDKKEMTLVDGMI